MRLRQRDGRTITSGNAPLSPLAVARRRPYSIASRRTCPESADCDQRNRGRRAAHDRVQRSAARAGRRRRQSAGVADSRGDGSGCRRTNRSITEDMSMTTRTCADDEGQAGRRLLLFVASACCWQRRHSTHRARHLRLCDRAWSAAVRFLGPGDLSAGDDGTDVNGTMTIPLPRGRDSEVQPHSTCQNRQLSFGQNAANYAGHDSRGR